MAGVAQAVQGQAQGRARAGGREAARRKSRVLGALVRRSHQGRGRQDKHSIHSILSKDLRLHAVSHRSAAAPAVVPSLPGAPRAGKTQPTTSSSSDSAGAALPCREPPLRAGSCSPEGWSCSPWRKTHPPRAAGKWDATDTQWLPASCRRGLHPGLGQGTGPRCPPAALGTPLRRERSEPRGQGVQPAVTSLAAPGWETGRGGGAGIFRRVVDPCLGQQGLAGAGRQRGRCCHPRHSASASANDIILL